MFRIVPQDSKFDFMGKAPMMAKVSIAAFVGSLFVVLILPMIAPGVGLKLGLDFSGGHEILTKFARSDVTVAQVRDALTATDLGDTSVQSYEIPGVGAHFLVRVQRAEALGADTISSLDSAFQKAWGGAYKGPIEYDKEVGTVIEIGFTGSATAATSSHDPGQAIKAVVEQQKELEVNSVKSVGRPGQERYRITIRGVDRTVINALKVLDPQVSTARVEFVGPTVGKQLRDDGILAVLYALLCILIYIALRFDFFYSPGAIACLFHDAIITVGILAAIGHEFSLTTIAGVLTLVGYSINDTIVVFDRIRETVGRVQGKALAEVINRALNETLGRTLMTSITTFVACVCLCVFGRKTVLFDFGLILAIGVIIGTYSTIFVASPLFMMLRDRFGPQQEVQGPGGSAGKL